VVVHRNLLGDFRTFVLYLYIL